jgi:hypothetical protein
MSAADIIVGILAAFVSAVIVVGLLLVYIAIFAIGCVIVVFVGQSILNLFHIVPWWA